MTLKRLKTTLVGAAALVAAASPAVAQISDNVVKIGVLTDMQGTYSDLTGKGSVEAARMAIADFGGKVKGVPIELVFADHQNKADIASNKAREWYDVDKVDMINDLVTSSVAIAVQELSKNKNRVSITVGAASSDLTGKLCTATGIHYAYDTYALAKGTGAATVKNGGDSWFFLTADYAFGHALERDTSAFVTAAGGKVLGQVRHPFPNQDFSSFLLQAQASKAKVIGLANAGQDTILSIKQAAEFGIVESGQRLAGLLMFITDVHALGLKTAQGLMLTTGYYWDLDDETRAFGKRYFEKTKAMPSMVQAGVYSSTMAYLKAIDATGTDEAQAVVKQMKKEPIKDFFAKGAQIREDGRLPKEMYLVQVKKPGDSKGPWDYYNVVQRIPGDEAYRPMKDGGCPLVTAAK